MKDRDYPWENFVFEGGGQKGLAYVGALEVAEEEGVLDGIMRVAGASVGAITALIVSLGYSVKEIREIQDSLKLEELTKDGRGLFLDAYTLLKYFAIHNGNNLEAWLGGVLKEATGKKDITFYELHTWRYKIQRAPRDLWVIGSNLNRSNYEIYSTWKTPQMKVLDAVMISCAVPLFFPYRKNRYGHMLVDGGLIMNYPVRVFDKVTPGEATLGFMLGSRTWDTTPRPISGIAGYIKAIVNTLLDLQEIYHRESEDWGRTVYIDTLGVEALDFKISPEKKLAIINSGRTSMKKYLQEWEQKEKVAQDGKGTQGLT